MTPPPLPSISGSIQTTSASSTAEAAAAAATTEPPPPASTSTEEDPNDECVLCCYPLPLRRDYSRYNSCCGEIICMGCIIAQKRTLIIGTNVKKPIAGSKEEELEFLTIHRSKRRFLCPFCREPLPRSKKKELNNMLKRIDKYNDPRAMHIVGNFYLYGEYGLPKDLKKAEELHQRAYDLGESLPAYVLAFLCIHDEARMLRYAEEGERRGNYSCLNFPAFRAAKSGNHDEANRQFMIAARAGNDLALSNLKDRFQKKLLSKEDLATTLHAHKAANDKGKSEPREYAMRHKAFEEKRKEQHKNLKRYHSVVADYR